MIDWLLLATVMAVIAILINGAGIARLGRVKRNAFIILSIVLRLFTLHGIKIGLYHWRLARAIEGLKGILLLGRSTTYFVTVVDRRQR
jgi:hypothetical protein